MHALLTNLVLLGPQAIIESRTLVEDMGGGVTGATFSFERIVTPKGFVYITRTLDSDGSVGYEQFDYSLAGVPVSIRQEGFWNGRWNTFQTLYGKRSAIQTINETKNKASMPASRFKDVTKLWFWKVKPKVGTRVMVEFLVQNTIDVMKIRFTYEGTDTMTIMGRTARYHRVREYPMDSGAAGVYTIWWYDDKGMRVKRYHKTTTKEFRSELISWR
jgi:hypothetical protein